MIYFEMQILDNMKMNENGNVYQIYGIIPYALRSMLHSYLRNIKFYHFERILNTEINVVPIPWKTTKNFVDCRFFAMRHMETYQGGGNFGFKTDFEHKKENQKQEIIYLRLKYLSKILTPYCNLNRATVNSEILEYEELDESIKSLLKSKSRERILKRLDAMIAREE